MKKRAMLLIATSLLLGLTSCATYERCAEKYGVVRTDTLRIPYERLVAVEIAVPADSLTVSLPIAALHDTMSLSAQGMQLSVAVDKATGSATISAYVPPRVVRDTVALRDTIPVVVGSVALVRPPTVRERLWDGYKDVAAVGFMACLITIYILIKALKNGSKRS